MDGLRSEDLELVAAALGGSAWIVAAAVTRRPIDMTVLGRTAITTLALVGILGPTVALEGITAGRLVPAAVAAGLGVLTIHSPATAPLAEAPMGAAVAIAALALYAAVPETSGVLIVGIPVAAVGAAIALRAEVTAAARGAAVAALALVAASGSPPVGVRTVGAAATLGLLMWWPLGRLVGRGLPGAVTVPPGWWLLISHALLALLAARWIAVADDPSLARLLVTGAAGTAIGAAVAGRDRMTP